MSESFSAIGFLVHTPLGPRKSGMPESVEMPAPVSTTTRSAPSTQARAVSRRSMAPMIAPRRAVLEDGQPAVDGERGAGDERGFVRREPEDRPGDLRGLGPAPEQRVVAARVPLQPSLAVEVGVGG